MGIKDTACYYYEQLMECGTLYARADAAWNLAQYAIQEQNSEKAYNFLNQYIKPSSEKGELVKKQIG